MNSSRYRVILPDHEVIQLHRNTRPEYYEKNIIEKIKHELPLQELSRYPDIDSFFKILSEFIQIAPANILLTSGIDGAIKTIMETFLSSGSTAAILTPTYKMYEVYAEKFGVELIKIQSKQDLTIDINEILKAIPLVKVLFIPNPHEPVENVFNRGQLLNICSEAQKSGVLVVIDEAYYMFGGPTMIDVASNESNLLVMRSFSKGFGLPSIRLGYTIGNEQLISKMQEKRLAYETNSLSIWVATWALNNFEIFAGYMNEVIQARTYLKNELTKGGFGVHGDYSNTILINLCSKQEAIKIGEKLKDNDIWVRVLSDFLKGNWVSVTVGNMSTVKKFLDSFLF